MGKYKLGRSSKQAIMCGCAWRLTESLASFWKRRHVCFRWWILL